MFFLSRLFRRRWLIVGGLLGGVVLLWPTPAGLTLAGQRTLALVAVATWFFITEPLPLPGVALLIIVFQVLFGLGTSQEVAKSVMSDSVFFIMGSLMMSVALVKQKFDRRLAYLILRLTGPQAWRLVLGFAAVSALVASFIGEHTTAAILLPVALAILSKLNQPRPRVLKLAAALLFAITYGVAIGGIGTPSGGARNAIMISYWRDLAHLNVSYLDWLVRAYPLTLVQIPLLAGILLWTFPPEVKDLRRALARLRREVRIEGKLSRSDQGVILWFLLVTVGWITLSGRLGLGTIALAGAAGYLALGTVRWSEVNSGVNWGVVWLYAAAISLGVQLERTGAARWIAEGLLGLLTTLHLNGGLPLLMALSGLTLAATHTMSTGAAVAVLGPIALQVAALSGNSALAAGFTVALSSAFGYMVVASTPAAMIVYGSGYLTTKDFFKAGWRMALASLLILWLALALFF